MVKKIIAGISAIAMSISAFAGIALAADPTYDISLQSGYNGKVAGKQRCVAVFCDGSAEAYSINTDLYLTVPAGTVTKVALRSSYGLGESVLEWDDDANDGDGGEVSVWKTLTWEKNIVADGATGDLVANDGRDTIKITAYGTTAYHGKDNMLCEIRLTQTDVNNDLDIILEKGSNYQTCDQDKTNTQNHTLAASKKYTIASGTSNVTEASTTTTYNVTCDTVTNGTLSVDKTTAAEGDTVTITATPADNYKLDTLKVEGNDGTNIAVTASNTFTMPAQNVTVKATFVEDQPAQSDFTKVGSYTSDESDKDKAVAFVQKLADMVSTKTYKLYAMVGDKKYNCTKTFTLPNITEGAISLGVVIQYNPDEVTPNGFNPENVTAFGVTEVE